MNDQYRSAGLNHPRADGGRSPPIGEEIDAASRPPRRQIAAAIDRAKRRVSGPPKPRPGVHDRMDAMLEEETPSCSYGH